MTDDQILFSFVGDGSDVMAVIDEIDTALAGLEERLASFIEAATGIGAATEQLDGLAVSADGADNAAATLSAALDDVAAQASAAGAGLDGAGAGASSMAAEMDAAAASTQANTDALGANAAAADVAAGSHAGAGAGAAAAAGQLGMVGLAAAGATAAIGYFGMGAQNSLNVVAALTGATASEMKTYTQGAQDLSVQMGSSLKATGDGLYYVASAGFRGNDALTVLKPAMMDAAAGGANLADVSNGLTSAMNAYGASANDAMKYSDTMLQAVTDGKQTFSDFANSIGVASVTGRTTGVSFQEVAAAEATMTQSGLSAHRAVMNLDFTMRAVGLSVDKVADTANGLGLSFDKSKYASLDFIGKLQYLQQISGGNMSAFEKLVGGANGLTTAQILLSDKSKTYTGVLKDMQNSSGATQRAFKTHEETMGHGLETLGASLSVFAYKIVQLATPAVLGVFGMLSGAVKGLTDFITQHGNVALPILGVLAALIGGLLVAALYSFASGMIAATIAAAPVILIVAGIILAVGLLVAGFKYAWDHSEVFRKAIETVGHVLSQFGATLKSGLMPAWKELQAAFVIIGPVLKIVGEALAGIALILLGLFVGSLEGAIHAVASFVDGVAQFFHGLVQIVQGILTLYIGVIVNAFKLVWDFMHGDTKAAQQDVLNIWNAIKTGVTDIVGGLWNAIQGLWKVSIGAILADLGGFIDGIVQFFQGLFDTLVGHSIVTDMITAIIGLFTGMPGAVFSVLAGFFGDLPQKFTKLASDIIDGLTNGISNLAHKAVQAAQNLGGKVLGGIKTILGIASPSREMALIGENTAEGFVQGIMGKQSAVQQALGLFGLSGTGAASAFSGLGSSATPLVTAAVAAGSASAPSVYGGATAAYGNGAGDVVAQNYLAQILSTMQRLVDDVETGGVAGGSGAVTALVGGGAQSAQQALAQQDFAGNLALRRPGGFRRPGSIGGAPLG